MKRLMQNKNLLLLLSVVAVAVVIVGPQGLGLLGLLGVGAVIGDRLQDNTINDFLKRDVLDDLILKRTDAHPIDTILRRTSTVPVTQEKVEWYSKDPLPRETTAAGAVVGGGTTDTLNVAAGTGSFFQPDDALYLPADDDVVLVTAVATDALTVTAIDGDTVPAIADGDTVIRMGRAKEEFFTKSDSKATQAVQHFNYVQAMDGVIQISGRRAETQNHTTTHSLQSDIDNQIYDFNVSNELTLIAGKRSKQTIGGANVTSMGGLQEYITTHALTYSAAAFSETDLIDWTRQVRTGNSGSTTRWLFADPQLTADLLTIPLDKVRRDQVESKELLMDVTRIETTFLNLNVVPHFGLTELGLSRYGLILDMEQIKYGVLRPRKTVRLLLEETGTDGRGFQIKEEATLVVGYEETHAIISGTA